MVGQRRIKINKTKTKTAKAKADKVLELLLNDPY